MDGVVVTSPTGLQKPILKPRNWKVPHLDVGVALAVSNDWTVSATCVNSASMQTTTTKFAQQLYGLFLLKIKLNQTKWTLEPFCFLFILCFFFF